MSVLPGVNPLTYTSTSNAYPNMLGKKIEYNGKNYVHVYNAGADAFVVGDVVGAFSTTPADGHADATAATVCANSFLGIAVTALAAASYGFVQCGGYTESVVTTDGTVAAADTVIGWANAADSSTTSAAGSIFLNG